MSQNPTLRDVANQAGVSLGTASQAINNRGNVSPATRSRVLEAAKALGYAVREAGGETQESPLSVIGMLSSRDYDDVLSVNPFYSYVQLGVESECRKRGISLMFSSIEVDRSKRPVSWPAMINEQRVEGLVLIGAFVDDTIDLINKKVDGPVVLIDSYSDAPLDSILTDNEQGTKSAMQYLIDQGHRRIGLIGWAEYSTPSIQERKEAYQRTLRENGIEAVYIEESRLERAAAQDATRRLLARAPEVTAIFGCNDDTAIAAMNAAQELGRRVPDDLSVIGFDNIDLSAEITPALTTVHVYKTWMGILGVRQLVERSLNPDQPKLITRIATQLMVRDSVRAVSS